MQKPNCDLREESLEYICLVLRNNQNTRLVPAGYALKTPMELGPQDGEIIAPGGGDQPERKGGGFDLEDITLVHIPGLLSIDDNLGPGAVGTAVEAGGDDTVGGQDDRPAAEHEGTDRGNEDCGQAWMNKRATGREVVGRGTGRGGKDQAVGLVGGDGVVVGPGGQIEETILRLLVDDDFIEGIPFAAADPTRQQLDPQHLPVFDGHRSSQEGLEGVFRLRGRKFGEEPR